MGDHDRTTIAFAALGAIGTLFALGVAYWWAAHHMDWWTFAIALGGMSVALEFVKIVYKDAKAKTRRR